MQFHTGRSFTIACVIVLVITRYTSNGFTIRKASLKNGPDLDTGESSLLEIRDNVPNTTQINTLLDDNIKNEEKKQIVIALKNLNDTKIEISKSNHITGQSISTQNTPPLQKPLGINKHETDVTFSTISSLESTSNLPATKEISKELKNNVVNRSMSSTTSSAFHYSTSTELDPRNKEHNSSNKSSMPTEQMQQKINQTKLNTSEIVASPPISKQFNTNITGTDNNDLISRENHNVTSTPSLNYKDKNNEAQASSKKPVYTTTYSLTESKLASRTNVDLRHSKEPTITLNIDSTDTSSKPNYKTELPVILRQTFDESNFRSRHTPTTELPIRSELTYFADLWNTPSTTELQISQSNTKDVTDDQYITTLSPLQINKIKEEKKISEQYNDYSTISEAISAATNFPLEKLISSAAVPFTLSTDPKKNLRNDLKYSTNERNGTSTTITHRKSTPFIESLSTLPARANTAEQLTDKQDIFSSNRAGYLDNSETTTRLQETTTEIYMNIIEITNGTDRLGSIYETEVSDGDSAEGYGNKNTIAMESQSQLADDAMKEELLIEKTLNENELLKSKRRNFHLTNYSSAANDIITTTESTDYSNNNNVIPIGSDKRKNTILYTLSSNYKPPKKLEVLPTKPFVRDPDDNSWRNESISSLGIVFKAKNPSKSFTEVLKNKTTELSHIVRNDYKNEVPDLRLRLEKMTEVRKSKKKRINKFGDTLYSDYEESSENTNYLKEGVTSPLVPIKEIKESTTTPLPIASSTEASQIPNAITGQKFDIFGNDITTPSPKEKTKKLYNLAEYYDTTDDYDADYVTLPKIDIQKFSLTFKNKDIITTPLPDIYLTRPSDEINTKPITKTYQTDRQATVQYFPPTKKVTVPVSQNNDLKVTVSSLGDDLKNNMFSYDGTRKTVFHREPSVGDEIKNNRFSYDVAPKTVSNKEPSARTKLFEELSKSTTKPLNILQQINNLDRSFDISSPPITTELPRTFVPNDGNFNRASYIIKHYGDFINDAAKVIDEERSSIFLPYTNAPLQGVTMKFNAQKESKTAANYDYDAQFRKDVVNRFVDNFNENSDRFKVDFPILYNSSVVHTNYHNNGKVLASSNMFMKRLHETRDAKSNAKLCDFNCERMTIEISPSYELHYYVPEQEETEVMQPRANTYPYTYPYHFRL